MMKYKNLFIDLDDTLWDTYHNNKECLKELYADYKMDRHYASFEAFLLSICHTTKSCGQNTGMVKLIGRL